MVSSFLIRHGHTATAVDSRVYVIGGRQGMEVFGSVYCFDMTTGRWSCVLRKGVNMAHHSAVLHWRPASLGAPQQQRSRAAHAGTQSFPEIVVLVQGEIYCFDVDRAEWRQPEVDSSALNARGGGRMGQARVWV